MCRHQSVLSEQRQKEHSPATNSTFFVGSSFEKKRVVVTRISQTVNVQEQEHFTDHIFKGKGGRQMSAASKCNLSYVPLLSFCCPCPTHPDTVPPIRVCPAKPDFLLVYYAIARVPHLFNWIIWMHVNYPIPDCQHWFELGQHKSLNLPFRLSLYVPTESILCQGSWNVNFSFSSFQCRRRETLWRKRVTPSPPGTLFNQSTQSTLVWTVATLPWV